MPRPGLTAPGLGQCCAAKSASCAGAARAPLPARPSVSSTSPCRRGVYISREMYTPRPRRVRACGITGSSGVNRAWQGSHGAYPARGGVKPPRARRQGRSMPGRRWPHTPRGRWPRPEASKAAASTRCTTDSPLLAAHSNSGLPVLWATRCADSCAEGGGAWPGMRRSLHGGQGRLHASQRCLRRERCRLRGGCGHLRWGGRCRAGGLRAAQQHRSEHAQRGEEFQDYEHGFSVGRTACGSICKLVA